MEQPKTLSIEAKANEIIQEIKEYQSKNIYIIQKDLDSKIPQFLSFLLDNKNDPKDKLTMISYIDSLISNIAFNIDIILKKQSKDEKKLNLYQIIIEQFIFCDKNESDYSSKLKSIYNKILSVFPYNRDIYYYIFSYVSDFLDKKNRGEKIINFTSENYNKLLELIQSFYQHGENLSEPYNYFYFNGDSNSKITVNDKNNLLKEKTLNILFFIKLVEYQYIKAISNNNNENEIYINIIKFKFNNDIINFSININMNKNDSSNDNKAEIISSNDEKIISIPLNLFNEKKTNSLLLKLLSDKIEIYINNNEINLNSNFPIFGKGIYLNSIEMFSNFYGQCSSIMIYKGTNHNLPSIFYTDNSSTKTQNKSLQFTRKYSNGFYNEELLNVLNNTELKNLSNENNEIKSFINNLISIYIPTRTINDEEDPTKKIILKDSISNLDCILNISSEINEGGTSLHTVSKIVKDFRCELGINHFLPLMELMTNYNEMLSVENLGTYLNIINNLFSAHVERIANEINTYFFYYLSYFLEQIPDSFFEDNFVVYKCLVITLMTIDEDNQILKMHKKQFIFYILLNDKILFKFSFKNRQVIFDQVYPFLINPIKSEEQLDFDICIINFLLAIDKQRYKKYCCEKHAKCFDDSVDIVEPSISECAQPIIRFISLLFDKFIKEYQNYKINDSYFYTRNQLINIFEILALDLSPCMQQILLATFFLYFKSNYKIYEYLNYQNKIIIIYLFLFKTSIFDIKEYIYSFLIDFMNKNNDQNNDNVSKLMETYLINNYYYNNEDSQVDNNNINVPKNEIKINGIEYILVTVSNEQKNLYKVCNKNYLYQMTTSIYNKIFSYFNSNKCPTSSLNMLIKIASKGDIKLILDLLEKLQKILSTNNAVLIFRNQKLLHWLLETNFHSFLYKQANFDEKVYKPGFILGEMTPEEIKTKIESIITISNDIILRIFLYNILKVDYLLTWSKYYYDLQSDKNNFKLIKKYIYDTFLSKLIISLTEKVKEKSINNNDNQSHYYTHRIIYLYNILFEYYTFYKITGFISEGEIKDKESLYKQVCETFKLNLIREIRKENMNEIDTLPLSEKWKEYLNINSLYSFFQNLWNKNWKFYDEIDVYKTFINGQKNIFIEELYIFFNDVKIYTESVKDECANLGTELLFIIYHYYTMLFTVIYNKNEFKGLINDYRSFMTLIIISSTTLTIYNANSTQNNDKAKSKIQWPNLQQYKRIQEIVKKFLFINFSYLLNKINEIDDSIIKLQKNPNSSENQEKIIHLENIYFYLCDTILYFLRILNDLYRGVKKDQNKKNQGFLSTMKKYIFTQNEGIQCSGSYLFIKEFYEKCWLDKINITTGDNSIAGAGSEPQSSILDSIPQYTLNSINNKDFETDEKLHNRFRQFVDRNLLKNQKIGNYIKENDNYKIVLFPFIDYIIKRQEFVFNIIPIYDNRKYVDFNVNSFILNPNYLQKSDLDKLHQIININKDIVNELRQHKIKQDFDTSNKINGYRKFKKKLFSFNNIYSIKKYFYDKKKYIIKYKLINYLTNDYSRIFLTPIIDIDYYLPKFSKFEVVNLFRKTDNITQITKAANLLMTQPNKNLPKEKNINDINIVDNKNEVKSDNQNKCNGLYLIKEAEYKYMDDLDKNIEGIIDHYTLFKNNFVNKRHKIKPNYHNNLEDACLVKAAFHIRGIFYSNEKEIGFYNYDKMSHETQKDFDPERKSCFGSVFHPQNHKYNNFYMRIPYINIAFILKRRYYFKVSALEIFTTNNKSYFFKFKEDKLEDILENIRHYLAPDIDDINILYNKFYKQIGFVNKKSYNFNNNKKIYERNYMNLSNIYEKWQKWEISTMKMLMIMNFYANRSYNDINQYPVFPWIITDYSSENILLSAGASFIRPFDTPMGMLEINEDSKSRKQDYVNHWMIGEDEDEEERDENYDRYGSHYSTSLYVTYYLLRVFPFANIRLELQGTNFDDPNRLFNTICGSFECSSTQKSDVRELVPELFCFPEALYNNNDFNLGSIRDHKKKSEMKLVNEVESPNWAKNDGFIFVNMHREFLESYEISDKINMWFNIIFGSKQKGKSAKEIRNLFNKQTYEDFEKEYDESSLEEKMNICRMAEFGITPHQIFKSDTSKRKISSKIKQQLLYNTFENEKLVKQNKQNRKYFLEIKELDCKIHELPYKILNISKEKRGKNIYIFNNKRVDIYSRIYDRIAENESLVHENIGSDDNMIIPYEDYQTKINVVNEAGIDLFYPRYGLNYDKLPFVIFDKGHNIAFGGYWNGDLIIQKIIRDRNSINNNSTNENIINTDEHSPIVKIIIDKEETYSICANKNGTIYIYKLNPTDKFQWNLYKKFNDSNNEISSMAISSSLNILITCSKDGYLMLYTLNNFKLFNSFLIEVNDNKENLETNLSADIIFISSSPLPCFIFYVDSLKCIFVYSVNGHLLTKKTFEFFLDENSIKIYKDYQFKDYLFIFNRVNNAIDIYNIIDMNLVVSSPNIKHTFIDFFLNEEMTHALLLVQTKEDHDYKLLVIKDKENELEWK